MNALIMTVVFLCVVMFSLVVKISRLRSEVKKLELDLLNQEYATKWERTRASRYRDHWEAALVQLNRYTPKNIRLIIDEKEGRESGKDNR